MRSFSSASSLSSSNFSSASVHSERDRKAEEVAGQTLRTFLDIAAPVGSISRAEAVVGGRRLGLTASDVDAVFAELAHDTTALVDEGDFLRACAQRSAATHFSFASPDADWCAPRSAEMAAATAAESFASSNAYDMSHLSWASPESDHSACRPAEFLAARSERRDLSHLSWTSPEADFTSSSLQDAASPSLTSAQQQQQPAPRASSWLDLFLHFPTSLSFASPEADFTGPLHTPRLKSSLFLLDDQQQQQQQQQQQAKAEAEAEERHFVSLLAQQELDLDAALAAEQGFFTLHEALAPSVEARVLTKATAPFEICNVNDAWSSLCGFSGEVRYHCVDSISERENAPHGTPPPPLSHDTIFNNKQATL